MTFYGPPGTRIYKPYNLNGNDEKAVLESWKSSTEILDLFNGLYPNVQLPVELKGDTEKYPCDEYIYSVMDVKFAIRRSGSFCYCAYVDLDCSEYQEITGGSEHGDGWDYFHAKQGSLTLYTMNSFFWKDAVPVTHDMVLEDVTKTIISVKNDQAI